MMHTVETIVTDISLPYDVNQMAIALKTELNKRFGNIEDNEIISQATILDPRFKKFGFINENKFDKAFLNFKSRIGNVRLPSESTKSVQSTSVSTEMEISTPKPSTSLLWKIYEEKIDKLKSKENSTAAGIIELDKYMQEPLINRDEDPLKWWYDRKNIYPRLYTFVLKRPCVTTTSVPCERIFSEAGQTITLKRNRLSTKKASQLVYLHNNL